jgi:hypothetical protein
MNKKVTSALTITFLLGAGIALLVWYEVGHSAEIVTTAKINLEQKIERELSRGTPNTQIENFLQSNGFSYTSYPDIGDRSDLHHGAKALIEATYNNSVKTRLYDCKIFVTFELNEDNSMMGYSDRSSCSGPF